MQPSGSHPGGERGQEFLGRLQEVFAFAGAFAGQDGVAAGDQPLAGEVRGGDLGQVLLIEQRQLQRSVIGHQLLDRRGAQRGDPPVGARLRRSVFGRLVQCGDAGAGDHAPVADHDHLGQGELVPHDLDDAGERGRVAGVAGSTRTATGRPSGSVSSPYSICSVPFLPSRE